MHDYTDIRDLSLNFLEVRAILRFFRDITDIRNFTDTRDLSLYFLEYIHGFRSGSGILVRLPLLNRHPLLKSFEFRVSDDRQVFRW